MFAEVPPPAAAALASLHSALNSLLLTFNSSEAGKGLLRLEVAAPLAQLPCQRSSWSSNSAAALSMVSKSSQQPLAHLNGTWIKDKAASDSMEPVLRLMHMRGVVRQAIKLLKGVTIKTSADRVTVQVFSVIGWFKVTEHYPLSGEAASWKRRDLRRGNHEGRLRLLPPAPAAPSKILALKPQPSSSEGEGAEQMQGPWGRFAVDLTWQDPHCGTGVDVYELVSPDVLHVHSTLRVAGDKVHNTAVFNRKK